MLKEKYASLIEFASKASLKDTAVTEEGNKLKIKATAKYQLDKDVFWDKVKTFSNWETEIGADIRVEKGDIYGVYTVKPGDTLSKLAKEHFGSANRYMEIFNANKDVLTNPDMIKVGQELKLPNR